jgi:TP901 family phage tail tape measure protein
MASAFKIPTIFSAIDKFSSTVKKMQGSVKNFVNMSEADIARFERKWRNIGDMSARIAKRSAIIGLAIAAPLIVAANDAIKFEDQMADVAKTTNLSGQALKTFGSDLLGMSTGTRTSIDELQKIAAIGGQMGVSQNELLGFTESVNKFNVALGSDFSGGVEGATKAISGLKGLFKDTRGLQVADAINKTGSAINALSSKGVIVPEVTEFMSRIGQLPDSIKPSIQNTAALGATFNKAGITAEIASRAFGDVLLTGAANLPKFAKQMKLTEQEASKLINTNPTEFVLKFSESLKTLNAQGLSTTLKSLKLTDAGAIKVVGALGSSTKMLGEFQNIANEEFKKGTSLLNEYNTKNDTTKANIEKAVNNFKALSITIGTELLPVISDLIKKMTPVIKGFLQWSKNNSATLKTMVLLTVGISALSFAISGLSSVVFIFSGLMKLLAVEIAGVSVGFRIAYYSLVLWQNAVKAATAVQWLFNASNPVGWVIILIGLITVIVHKWNQWGAALSMVLGPLGMLISFIQSLRRNWDMVTEAFKSGGIFGALRAIKLVLYDSILQPVQQLLKLIGNITGATWATQAAKGIGFMRQSLGVNTTTDESGQPLQTKAINPKAEDRANILEMISSQFNSTLTIQDNTGRGKLSGDKNPNISLMAPKLSSTVGF